MTPTALLSGSRLRTQARRLAESLATPLVPSDYLDLLDPLRAGASLRARVVAVEPETADAATLVLQPGRRWRGHTPGQYIRLGVDVDGVRRWRAYSLTSRVDEALLTVTVKAIPDGVVSNHLVRRLRPGTVVELDQAAGDFTLPAERPSKALFVTAGSGLTPVMGMLRNALAELPDVVVLHSAPTADDVLFASELRAWAATGRLTLIELHTETDGMLSVTDLDAIVPDWAERETWACGPTGLLDAVEKHWDCSGVADRLHTERFRPTVITPGEGGTVAFTRTGTTVEADGATPLLEAGEASGVLMPSGCRMGICFGCVVPLRQGAVRDLRNGQLTTATEDAPVLIQTCVSAAAGACDIDL